MTTILSIIFALIIFEGIIVIHELGHFMVAKKCGVKVNQFAIGMGPAIFKKQKGETLYALRVFPIGGFCAMEGEDGESSDSRAFGKKKPLPKIAIVSAGIVMNLILGFILMAAVTCMSDAITSTTISKFYDNARSHETGLEEGDKILSVNGMRIFTSMDIVYQFQNDSDGVFDMTVRRDGKKMNLENVTFDMNKDENGSDKKHLVIDFMVKPIKLNPITVTSEAFRSELTYGRLIYISLFDMVRGKYSLNDLSGPVGIVQQIDEVIDSQTNEKTGIDWRGLSYNMLTLGGFISINIGLFNLLPLPALDGGRLIFLLIELVRRKPVDPKYESAVHLVGMALLLLLMLVVTVSDITKLFH
ncbi:regulator of sigma E protease [Ruminococcus sp. YE71]|uniref:M50 family metallopeptidase n=1 Tax=unclassified Ruminococcus TaxID=2608920 RepID=UPI000883E369|nr:MULTISPECIES: site-2 protease family protein [unclassified Ruminococcus]SDA20910.1 regulator of sigma E protease [Ruminococcus sp. YE78]SFW33378.1 regulator of sigma E protease [Ruminococcus sp. YE71]